MLYQISHGCNSQPEHCCTHIRYLSASMINPPHTITPCTVTSPFPSPPHFALTPSHLTCLTGSQFIYIITLHFICGTYIRAYIKGTLRHVSYFHCRHVHYTIPAVTELYRHSIVLRYCRYMHSMCPLAS